MVDDNSTRRAPAPPVHPPEARAHGRLQVPVPVLRSVAQRLAAVAEPVRESVGRTPGAVDAGPARAALAGLLTDVEGAVAGLASRLSAVSGSIRATAEDLADTDAQAAMRFLGPDGDLFTARRGG